MRDSAGSCVSIRARRSPSLRDLLKPAGGPDRQLILPVGCIVDAQRPHWDGWLRLPLSPAAKPILRPRPASTTPGSGTATPGPIGRPRIGRRPGAEVPLYLTAPEALLFSSV